VQKLGGHELAREIGHAGARGELRQGLQRLEPIDAAGRPRVGPEDQGRQGLVGGIEQDEAVGLRGEGDGGYIGQPARLGRAHGGDGARHSAAEVDDLHLQPLPVRRGRGGGHAMQRDELAALVEQARLEVRGAQVDGEDQLHFFFASVRRGTSCVWKYFRKRTYSATMASMQILPVAAELSLGSP
jgi:hypothetical protein